MILNQFLFSFRFIFNLLHRNGLKPIIKYNSTMAYQTFLHEYMQIPIVTRVYTTACVITTIAVVSNYLKYNLINYN